MISFLRKAARALWLNFTATLLAAFVGLLVIFFDVFLHLELFARFVAFVSHIDVRDYELDEIILLSVIVMMGSTIDMVWYRSKTKHDAKLQEERLRAMRLTMVTVEDIVNNLLNNMQYFRLKSEQGKVLDAHELALLDKQVKETTEKLKKIHALAAVIERDFGQGISGLKLDH